MKPVTIEYGERYSDNSGWERRLSVDIYNQRVELESLGSSMSILVDEMEWFILSLMAAREALGMDKVAIITNGAKMNDKNQSELSSKIAVLKSEFTNDPIKNAIDKAKQNLVDDLMSDDAARLALYPLILKMAEAYLEIGKDAGKSMMFAEMILQRARAIGKQS